MHTHSIRLVMARPKSPDSLLSLNKNENGRKRQIQMFGWFFRLYFMCITFNILSGLSMPKKKKKKKFRDEKENGK